MAGTSDKNASASPGHSELSTTDPSMARQYLTDAYGVGVRMSSASDHPRFQFAHTDAGAFAVSTLRMPADLHFDADAPGALVIAHLDAGKLEQEQGCGSSEERFGPGDVFLATQGDVPYSSHTLHAEVRTVTLGLPLLAEVADPPPVTGQRGPRFTSFTPATRALTDSWNNTLDYICDHLLTRDDITDRPLITGQAARLLAATALNTFPNTAMSEPTPTDGTDATPDTVRKAVAYTEENAHTDVSLADIAAAAHVTPRALQYAFRIHHGTSPLGHLRRVRLDRVHFDLLAADPATGATVAAIAASWGFANPGNFSALYQDIYGVTPRNTLAA